MKQVEGNRKQRLVVRPISWRSGRSTALTVSGYGIRFFVDRGRLIIEDGFANEGERRRTVLSRGTCRLQRIVIIGRTGLLTLDALQWLANLGIALLFVGIGGRLTSVFTPGGLEGSKVRLHRVQATARNSEVGVRVARLLIGKKLHGQLGNLDWMTDSGRQVPVEDRLRHQRMRTAASQLHALQTRVTDLTDLDEIVMAERAGAEIYWSALSGIALRWKPRAVRRVPAHWLATQPRESFRTGNRYGATDPTNALLNYGYALLEAETRIACLTAGLHPGLGIFHADRDARASFVYDVMEPARPIVDRLVLQFVQTHTLSNGDCWETREGFCRLDPYLTASLARWLIALKVAAAQTVRGVSIELNLSQRGVRSTRYQLGEPE